MAASAEAIGQLALAHLADDSTVSSISSPTSRQETLLSRFYTLARDTCLVEHPWKFATRRVLLVIHDSSDEDADLDGEWAFAFTMPSSSLRVVSVFVEGQSKMLDSSDFDIYVEADDTQLLLTNTDLDETYVKIIYQEDTTTTYPDYFTLALSYYLASLVAGPLIGGAKGVQLSDNMLKKYDFYLAKAKTMDARQSQISETYKDHYPSGILSNR